MALLQSQPETPLLDRARSLQGIPVRHADLSMRRTSTGGVMITARFPRRKAWFARFMPPVIERQVELDEIGAFVMEHVDGKRSVKEIVAAFNARFNLNRREAELCTVDFIRQLAQRRLISIVIP